MSFILRTDVQESLFQDFLSATNNSRILFSGPFGTGKTKFLTAFFENRKTEFIAVHLHPTDYSISSNDDIITYLKYDILVSLKSHPDAYIANEGLSFRQWISEVPAVALPGVAKVLAESLPLEMLTYLPKIGASLKAGGEALKLVYKVGKELHAAAELVASDDDALRQAKKVEDFVDTVDSSSFRSYDVPSQVISLLIGQLKGPVGAKKKVVLVIDDLDRIDPEHIFRIMNVFGSFINRHETKFNFDHIILVGDVRNLENIYGARYGKDADFHGFIDRFYSKQIFHFTNKDALYRAISARLNSVETTLGVDYVFHKENVFHDFLVWILTELIQNYDISLRAFDNYIQDRFLIPYSKLRSAEDSEAEFLSYSFGVFQVFDVLLPFFVTDFRLGQIFRRELNTPSITISKKWKLYRRCLETIANYQLHFLEDQATFTTDEGGVLKFPRSLRTLEYLIRLPYYQGPDPEPGPGYSDFNKDFRESLADAFDVFTSFHRIPQTPI